MINLQQSAFEKEPNSSEKSTEEPIQIADDGQGGKKLEYGNSHEMATTALTESEQATVDMLHEQPNGTAIKESEATSHKPIEPLEEADTVQPTLLSSQDIATTDQPIDSKVF